MFTVYFIGDNLPRIAKRGHLYRTAVSDCQDNASRHSCDRIAMTKRHPEPGLDSHHGRDRIARKGHI
jgi:hypothetical protein